MCMDEGEKPPCMCTHMSPDPVNTLPVAIYAQGVFHLNAWKMKIVCSTSLHHSNIVRGIGPDIAPPTRGPISAHLTLSCFESNNNDAYIANNRQRTPRTHKDVLLATEVLVGYSSDSHVKGISYRGIIA